jgi:hypothetical protein
MRIYCKLLRGDKYSLINCVVYLKIWKEQENYLYRGDGQLYTNLGDLE